MVPVDAAFGGRADKCPPLRLGFFFIVANQTTANRRGGLQSALVGKSTIEKRKPSLRASAHTGVAIPSHSCADCEIATPPSGVRNDIFFYIVPTDAAFGGRADMKSAPCPSRYMDGVQKRSVVCIVKHTV